MKVALIGAGSRGNIYAGYMYNEGIEIVAVCDSNLDKLNKAKEQYNVDDSMLFESFEDFAKLSKIADAVIIATMDKDHYEETMVCLEKGYDILLEKPISPDPEECIKIRDKALTLNRKVMVCHVLRYTNFYSEIKRIIDSKELGRVVTIQHAENVGNFHMAHSFVRGNWRNSKLASPIIMQKSCHDFDILLWLVGSDPVKISSFGNLSYFKKENAPAGGADRCLECPCSAECRFDVRKAYLPVLGEWPATVVCDTKDEKVFLETVKTSPYGRCVYKCDNDVCDNQVTNIEFANGVTASFTLTGLTNKMHRTIRIMCENGEIFGDDIDNRIKIVKYASNSKYESEEREYEVESAVGFHGGGDYGLSMDFINELSGKGEKRSSIEKSVMSHIMADAAERSRVTGEVITL